MKYLDREISFNKKVNSYLRKTLHEEKELEPVIKAGKTQSSNQSAILISSKKGALKNLRLRNKVKLNYSRLYFGLIKLVLLFMVFILLLCILQVVYFY